MKVANPMFGCDASFPGLDTVSVKATEKGQIIGNWVAVVPLAVLVFSATGFDYLWVGNLPLWLWLAIGTMLMAPLLGVKLSHIIRHARQLSWPVFAPALAFGGWILVRTIAPGGETPDAIDLVAFNLAAIFVLFTVYCLSSACSPVQIGLVIGLCGAFQGIVSVGQYLHIDAFWTIPDQVMAASSRGSVSYEEIGIISFADTGRVRGTNFYIHKFNATMGVMTCFLLVLTMLGAGGRHEGLAARFVFGSLTLISAGGLVLTFSRSTILGIFVALLALVPVLLRKRSVLPIVSFLALAGSGMLMFSYLKVNEASQFGRLFYLVDLSTHNDQTRLDGILAAVDAFLQNPLFGVGVVIQNSVGVHSLPIRILASYGLIGFALFIWGWFGVVRLLWSSLRNPSDVRFPFGAAGLAGVVVASADALTHTSGFLHHDITQATLFGVFLSFAAQARTPFRTSQLSAAGPRRS